ncbi:DUF2975 domain-containing protein [Novosphingobium sp. PS1R-30]|uniref:DUF2975 domain-containing protein n=1 Tax=Novosphingobium anseongense TaxID=3133436 RepID=A0ABU8S382_9SPHN
MKHKRDPLLTAARGVISLLLILLALTGLAMLIGAPLLGLWRDGVVAELTRRSGHAVAPSVVTEICAILVLSACIMGLAFQSLIHMRRIIDSVALGDPFAPVNAARLTRMGWLTAATQVVSFPIGVLLHSLGLSLRNIVGHPEFGAGLGGILMALLLFVLARVFREGARMREDLEGTV